MTTYGTLIYNLESMRDENFKKLGAHGLPVLRKTIEVSYNVNGMLDVIIEHWSDIDEAVRHDFARRIGVLDLKDSVKLTKGEMNMEEVEEDWF